MKIVHVVPCYTPVIGGVQEVARRIAEHSASKGNDVYVLTYNRSGNGRAFYPEQDCLNDVRIIRVKPEFMWSYGSYCSQLPSVLTSLRPDIVHVHGWRHPHCFQVASIKEKTGFKTILHSHAPFHRFSQLGLITWAYHRTVDLFMKQSLQKYDQLIALTPFEKDMLVGRLGAKPDKVAIVPNGLPDQLFDTSPNESKNSSVLHLGRINKEKNLTLLVRSMVRVNKKIDAKLVLVGPDEGQISELRNFSQKNRVSLQYLGPITNDAAKSIVYRECALFAQPSLYEAFGITLLEAQIFGKPCVITGEGGQTYAAPPGISSLHAAPNPESFGNAILQLLTNRELYEQFSFNARSFATRHLWSRILPKFDMVYDNLLN